jgi:antitoxin VapB
MELDAEEAILRREGDRLILEPMSSTPLLSLLATLKPIEEAFPDVDAGLPAAEDVRL